MSDKSSSAFPLLPSHLNARHAAFWLRRSKEFCEQGRLEEALQALDEGITLHESTVELLAERALRRCEAGRFVEAMQDGWDALAIDCPNSSLQNARQDARFALGYSLLMLRQVEEAELILEELLEQNPVYPDAAWLRAGIIRQRFGVHSPLTTEAYRQALSADPENVYVLAEWADILRALGSYSEAIEIYRELVLSETCVDDDLRAESAFKLGCVAVVEDDRELADWACRMMLQYAPDYPYASELHDLLAN